MDATPPPPKYFSLQSLLDLQELTDKLEECVDDAWRQNMYDPYPEERMAQFLGVVSGSLARAVQDRLSKLDLWEDSYLEV